MERKEELKIIVLSALLHDVGKFAQRAEAEKSPEDEYLQPKDRSGKLTHWHVLYTDYFIKNDLPLPEELELKRENIALLSSKHHKPENRLDQLCIAKADQLAAGIDRLKIEETEEGFKKARLISIFEEVRLKTTLESTYESLRRMRLFPFSLNNLENLIPVERQKEEDKNPEIFTKEYSSLYKQFLQELQKNSKELKKLSFTHYLSWLLRIFEKYMWCIPSSTYKAVPDISLYDHLVVTASVAQALWIYHTETKKPIDLKITDNKTFILLGGDLSGIQRYIFGVSETGKGLTKLIRGRSFYLQLLTKAIVCYILKKLSIYYPALIMDSAGKFIMLLPNLDEVRNLYSELKGKIDETFVKRFKGKLTLSMALKETSEKELLLENFSDTLDDFNQRLDEEKNRKLLIYLKNHGSIIGFDYERFSEKGVCEICDTNPAFEEEDGSLICKICSNQREIGERLPKTKYILFNDHNGIPLFEEIKVLLKDNENFNPKDMDLIFGIRSDSEKYGNMWVAGYLPKIEEEDLKCEEFLKEAKEEFKENEKEPDEKDLLDKPKTLELISFSALKKKDNEILGRRLLCVLKADVDNLGLIFSIGLQKRLSLSRFASLSRMLNAFFSGYLVEKIKGRNEYKDIYVVFAGGDDLFLIGPWHQAIDFALELREEFKKFCAENKDITLSCGLYLMRPKYPVRRAAEDAEELLERAKGRKEKNGVCIFDEILSWNELKEQVEFGKWLEERVDDENSKINRAFLYRFLTYMRQAKRYEENKKADELMFYPHLRYDIARNIVKTDKDGKVINKDEIDKLLEKADPIGQKRLAPNIVGIQYALCAIRR